MAETPEKLDRARGPVDDVPIEITVAVGRARPSVQDLMKLKRDAVLVLDKHVDDPVELYAGDRLIARGELQEDGSSGGRLAVRLTDVVGLEEGA